MNVRFTVLRGSQEQISVLFCVSSGRENPRSVRQWEGYSRSQGYREPVIPMS